MGTRWVYEKNSGSEHHLFVSGTQTFLGEQVVLVEDSPCCNESDVNVIIRFLIGADGSVYYDGYGTDETAAYVDELTRRYFHRVAAFESIAVPLGIYECYRIDTTDLETGLVTKQWLAADIGVVRDEVVASGRTRELLRLENGAVSTETSTWGALRARFR